MKKSMKKINKLGLTSETIRDLSSRALSGALVEVVGGLSGNACSYGLTGCGACPPQRASLAISNCGACATDICKFE